MKGSEEKSFPMGHVGKSGFYPKHFQLYTLKKGLVGASTVNVQYPIPSNVCQPDSYTKGERLFGGGGNK